MSLDQSLASLRRTWALGKEVSETVAQAVAAARADGATWEQVGMAMGMTKQGAHHRFGRLDDSEEEPQ